MKAFAFALLGASVALVSVQAPAAGPTLPVLCCNALANGSACTWSSGPTCTNPGPNGAVLAIPADSQTGGATVQLVTSAPYHGICWVSNSDGASLTKRTSSCFDIVPNGGFQQSRAVGAQGFLVAGWQTLGAPNQYMGGAYIMPCFQGPNRQDVPGSYRYGLQYQTPPGASGYACDIPRSFVSVANLPVGLSGAWIPAVPDVFVPPTVQ